MNDTDKKIILHNTKKDVLLLSMRKGRRKIKRRGNVNMCIRKGVHYWHNHSLCTLG